MRRRPRLDIRVRAGRQARAPREHHYGRGRAGVRDGILRLIAPSSSRPFLIHTGSSKSVFVPGDTGKNEYPRRSGRPCLAGGYPTNWKQCLEKPKQMVKILQWAGTSVDHKVGAIGNVAAGGSVGTSLTQSGSGTNGPGSDNTGDAANTVSKIRRTISLLSDIKNLADLAKHIPECWPQVVEAGTQIMKVFSASPPAYTSPVRSRIGGLGKNLQGRWRKTRTACRNGATAPSQSIL